MYSIVYYSRIPVIKCVKWRDVVVALWRLLQRYSGKLCWVVSKFKFNLKIKLTFILIEDSLYLLIILWTFSVLGILGGLGQFGLGVSNYYGYAVSGVASLLCYGLSLFIWYKHNSGAKPNPSLMIPSLVLIILSKDKFLYSNLYMTIIVAGVT